MKHPIDKLKPGYVIDWNYEIIPQYKEADLDYNKPDEGFDVVWNFFETEQDAIEARALKFKLKHINAKAELKYIENTMKRFKING